MCAVDNPDYEDQAGSYEVLMPEISEGCHKIYPGIICVFPTVLPTGSGICHTTFSCHTLFTLIKAKHGNLWHILDSQKLCFPVYVFFINVQHLEVAFLQ